MKDQLYTAIILATHSHNGQLDKAGEPYILHPLRLVAKTKDRKEQIVALLHDILEDTKVTEYNLLTHGFDKDVVEAVVALTRKNGEAYEDFIERVGKNELAARVKLLDLEDNMDLSRLKNVTEKDIERVLKYSTAKTKLLFNSTKEKASTSYEIVFNWEMTEKHLDTFKKELIIKYNL